MENIELEFIKNCVQAGILKINRTTAKLINRIEDEEKRNEIFETIVRKAIESNFEMELSVFIDVCNISISVDLFKILNKTFLNESSLIKKLKYDKDDIIQNFELFCQLEPLLPNREIMEEDDIKVLKELSYSTKELNLQKARDGSIKSFSGYPEYLIEKYSKKFNIEKIIKDDTEEVSVEIQKVIPYQLIFNDFLIFCNCDQTVFLDLLDHDIPLIAHYNNCKDRDIMIQIIVKIVMEILIFQKFGHYLHRAQKLKDILNSDEFHLILDDYFKMILNKKEIKYKCKINENFVPNATILLDCKKITGELITKKLSELYFVIE